VKKGICENCKNIRTLRKQRLCYSCHEDYNVRIKLQTLEPSLVPRNQYTGYLFQLYLTYIRRNRLKHYYIKQAHALSQILSCSPPEPLLTWKQVFDLSKKYGPYPPHAGGCPWRKIGRMLQELNVLPTPVDDHNPWIQNALAAFDPQTARVISSFLQYLSSRQRKTSTLLCQIYYLKKLDKWLRSQSSVHTLMHMNPPLMKNYFDYIRQYCSSPKRIRDHFFALQRFYRWCIRQKLILSHPCENITVSRSIRKLVICPPGQTGQLLRFVKNPEAPPEAAFLIAIVLLFGLTTYDLTYARISANPSGGLCLILRKNPRSYSHGRSKNLELPVLPSWFFNLQKRFFTFWQHRYSKSKKTYAEPYLILTQDHIANRPLKPDTIRRRFKKATILATGKPILIRVLRQTCGHIYARKSGCASLLTQFGWSSKTAFEYTWLPRIYTET